MVLLHRGWLVSEDTVTMAASHAPVEDAGCGQSAAHHISVEYCPPLTPLATTIRKRKRNLIIISI